MGAVDEAFFLVTGDEAGVTPCFELVEVAVVEVADTGRVEVAMFSADSSGAYTISAGGLVAYDTTSGRSPLPPALNWPS